MSAHIRLTAAILVPLMALGPSCANARREVRLAFDDDEGLVAPEPAPLVELSYAEAAHGFRTLAQDPQLIAFFRQPDGTGLHLLPASYALGDAFVPGYNQLCAARRGPADCLDLLRDGAFDTGDRQRVAMSIAWHSVAYVGWDTIFGIREGWKALGEACDSATSFADLRVAGERFGTIIGERIGRIIVMLVVAAMGASLGSFTARLASLPGFSRAAQFFQLRCGFSFGAVTARSVKAVTISASGVVVALAPGTAWAATNAMAGSGSGTEPPKSAPVGFKSHRAFKKAMGSAGPKKEWHHIVEQTDGNVGRFGAQRIHSTENEIALDKALHDKIGPFYSSIRAKITGSPLTVRKWLSTQSYEAQRTFVLQAMRNLADGTWE